jgi:hypothetical protein
MGNPISAAEEDVIMPTYRAKDAEGDVYEVNVQMDPIQYKLDLENLAIQRSKFIEDIFSSDCQLVVQLPNA